MYVPSKARKIINHILSINEEYRLRDEDYLFVHPETGKRMHSEAIAQRLMRYCKYANISVKSIHEIRKTYISTLIDSGVNINEIRKQVGHEDERITYQNYCFNRFSSEQTENQIEKALYGETKKESSNIVPFKVINGNQKVCSTEQKNIPGKPLNKAFPGIPLNSL